MKFIRERTCKKREQEAGKGRRRGWASPKQLGSLKLGWTIRVACLKQGGKTLYLYADMLLDEVCSNRGA